MYILVGEEKTKEISKHINKKILGSQLQRMSLSL